MKKRPKPFVSDVSYDIFMKNHEKESETVRFGHFAQHFHEKSQKRGRSGHFAAIKNIWAGPGQAQVFIL